MKNGKAAPQVVTVPKFKRMQPLERIEWVHRDSIQPNDYNPNKQPPPEHRLLKVSLLEDGWTQPIVVFDDTSDNKPVIVDGEHRWRASGDADVAAMTSGFVPIVRIIGDRGHRMMSTVRHNRARGEHHVLPMAELVRELLQAGVSQDEVQFYLQMEDEEVERLAERAGMPEKVGGEEPQFGKGWVPGK